MACAAGSRASRAAAPSFKPASLNMSSRKATALGSPRLACCASATACSTPPPQAACTLGSPQREVRGGALGQRQGLLFSSEVNQHFQQDGEIVEVVDAPTSSRSSRSSRSTCAAARSARAMTCRSAPTSCSVCTRDVRPPGRRGRRARRGRGEQHRNLVGCTHVPQHCEQVGDGVGVTEVGVRGGVGASSTAIVLWRPRRAASAAARRCRYSRLGRRARRGRRRAAPQLAPLCPFFPACTAASRCRKSGRGTPCAAARPASVAACSTALTSNSACSREARASGSSRAARSARVAALFHCADVEQRLQQGSEGVGIVEGGAFGYSRRGPVSVRPRSAVLGAEGRRHWRRWRRPARRHAVPAPWLVVRTGDPEYSDHEGDLAQVVRIGLRGGALCQLRGLLFCTGFPEYSDAEGVFVGVVGVGVRGGGAVPASWPAFPHPS